MQVDEEIDGKGIERPLVGPPGQHVGIGLVAEVLDHQQAVPGVLGEDLGRAVSQLEEVTGEGGEGAHVLGRRWRVHEDGALRSVLEPFIAAEGGVAGQRQAPGAAPTGLLQEGFDAPVAVHGGGFRQGRHSPAAIFQVPWPVSRTLRDVTAAP